MPANYIKIKKISQKYSIPLIEDAAEALGSKYNGKPCGTLGDINILSFNGNKIITTGGGGALVSKNKEYIANAKFLATQAREKKIFYEHKVIGYNYRLSNISAAIGLGQLNALDSFVKSRRRIYNLYKGFFKKYDFISFQEEQKGKKDNYFSNRWLTTILLDHKKNKILINKIIRIMQKNNIEIRPLWKPMHMQPVFKKYDKYSNDISQKLFYSGLCLPSGSNLQDNEIDKICSIFKRILHKY